MKSNRSRRTNSLRKRCLACLNSNICSRTTTVVWKNLSKMANNNEKTRYNNWNIYSKAAFEKKGSYLKQFLCHCEIDKITTLSVSKC